MSARLNEHIDISDISDVKQIIFDFDEERGRYSWIGTTNTTPFYIHPRSASAWVIKDFKTLNGAKRNFLKMMAR